MKREKEPGRVFRSWLRAHTTPLQDFTHLGQTANRERYLERPLTDFCEHVLHWSITGWHQQVDPRGSDLE